MQRQVIEQSIQLLAVKTILIEMHQRIVIEGVRIIKAKFSMLNLLMVGWMIESD